MHSRHLAVPRQDPPKNLTFGPESFIRQPYVSPRKISPVPKSGTAKTRFLPVLAGFSANLAGNRSRKASPLPRARPRLRAIPGQERVQMVIFPPEKAHQRHKTGVKRCRHREVLKSLTFRQPLKNTQSLPALTLDSSTGVFSQPRSRKYSPKDCAWLRGRLESRKSSPSRISSPWYRDPPERHAHQPVSAQRFR